MTTLPVLKPKDRVELIAPASRCSDNQLSEIKDLLAAWGLNCTVKQDIFGKDLLCANTDEARFNHLKEALYNPEIKAIVCVRGGYGAMRLIPELAKLNPPKKPKIFVGMSDITCLHLFLQQHWGWTTIHGAASPEKFSAQSLASLKSILFAEKESSLFTGLIPLNNQAKKLNKIRSSVTGGNLTIIQASIGTNWQIDARNKLILLEEINERAYRVDRMLEHLHQAHIFKNAAAILLGDFLSANEPDGTSLIEPVLARFAKQCEIPVVQIQGIGHGPTNFSIPCGTQAQLELGNTIQLTCLR
jgi:muramoyltetrapeptide carboxypeptidase